MLTPYKKHKKNSVVLFAFMSLFISSCVLNSDFESLTTDLQVKVKFKKANTEDSVAAAGATVILYKTLIDMETRQRPVAQGTTDGSGNVLLKNLESFAYYIYVFYDNNIYYYDNSIGNNTFGDVLVEGAVTVTTVPIQYQRSSNPTKFKITSMTIYKYNDTIGGISSGCSKNLRFRLFNNSGTKVDSTFTSLAANTSKCKYNFFSGYYTCSYYFCKTDQSMLFYYRTSTLQTIPPGDYDYFYIYLAYEASSNNYINYWPAYIYPAQYKKNNTFGNVSYPRRIRLWEDNTRVIDATIDWK